MGADEEKSAEENESFSLPLVKHIEPLSLEFGCSVKFVDDDEFACEIRIVRKICVKKGWKSGQIG